MVPKMKTPDNLSNVKTQCPNFNILGQGCTHWRVSDFSNTIATVLGKFDECNFANSIPVQNTFILNFEKMLNI